MGAGFPGVWAVGIARWYPNGLSGGQPPVRPIPNHPFADPSDLHSRPLNADETVWVHHSFRMGLSSRPLPDRDRMRGVFPASPFHRVSRMCVPPFRSSYVGGVSIADHTHYGHGHGPCKHANLKNGPKWGQKPRFRA